jgi:DNA anti-recombination protein RmuC
MWKEKYVKLEEQHKKIKNIAEGLIKMMKKVDGVEGDLHEAWKWVKKIVWEYEGIRTKALEWKAVSDQINEAVNLIEK